MANPNFVPVTSTNELYRNQDTNRCLTDDLDAIESDISALETGKADAVHTHDGYAPADHSHTGYAPADHSHTGYASSGHVHAPASIGAAAADHGHSYNDLDDKPSIPAPYTHPESHPASMITGLAQVATTGSYNDLTDKPDVPAGYTHPTSHPASMITGLAEVATSGSYNDLEDKPSIPSIPASLPANGGNADTLDNKHASDFAAADHEHNYAAASHGHTPVSIGAAPTDHASSTTAYGAASATAYGHAKASDTTPKAPGEAALGSETDEFARGDHVHPMQMIQKGVGTAGTGAAYTATVEGITALAAGVSFIMIPHVVSTVVNPTLNVNGLGAKNLRRRLTNSTISTTTASSAGWLGAGKPIRVTYDGAFWIADFDRPNANDIYGTVAIEHGGTGAATAAEALTNLGAVPSTGGTFTGPVTIKPQLYTAQILPFDGGSYSIGSSDFRYYSTYLRVNPNVSSDRRCKRDIAPMDVAALAAFVDKLSVVSYNYNDDAADEAKRIGLIAQEVVAADPTIANGCIEMGSDGFYGLRAADLVFPLIAAVQALTKRVEELEAK